MSIVYILIGLVALGVIVFLVIVALQPSDFRIERSGTISAPPEVVFSHINDLRKWEAWSPWQKIDPTMKQTYEGPPAGVGSKMSWVGNKKAGEGRITIMESKPSNLIRLKLEFLKPFAATNATEFTFKPQGNQTVINWSMTGTNNFVFKAFCMFMNMDKMVGGDFEKGLAQMKSVVESGS